VLTRTGALKADPPAAREILPVLSEERAWDCTSVSNWWKR